MSPREGVYYLGWMIGIIVVVSICRATGVHHLIGLILGLVIGLGIGTVAEKMYVQKFGDSKQNGEDSKKGVPTGQLLRPGQVACTKPGCNFVGDSREHLYCPKCDERLEG